MLKKGSNSLIYFTKKDRARIFILNLLIIFAIVEKQKNNKLDFQLRKMMLMYHVMHIYPIFSEDKIMSKVSVNILIS